MGKPADVLSVYEDDPRVLLYDDGTARIVDLTPSRAAGDWLVAFYNSRDPRGGFKLVNDGGGQGEVTGPDRKPVCFTTRDEAIRYAIGDPESTPQGRSPVPGGVTVKVGGATVQLTGREAHLVVHACNMDGWLSKGYSDGDGHLRGPYAAEMAELVHNDVFVFNPAVKGWNRDEYRLTEGGLRLAADSPNPLRARSRRP